jgi:hypothetical protein
MSCGSEHLSFRVTAWVAALCLLALTIFAASPGLHAELHSDEAAAADAEHQHDHGAPVGTADHECAVTLFANGATTLLVFCLLMLVKPLAAGVVLRAADEIAVARPRYWLVPSHAPPAA